MSDNFKRSTPIPFFRKNAATLFPDPFLDASGRDDAIGNLEWLARLQRLLHIVPDHLPIIGMNDLGIRNSRRACQFLGGVAGEGQRALADEVHRPILVVAAAIGHAGEIAHEREQGAATFPQGLLGALAALDVALQSAHQAAVEHQGKAER